MNTTPWAKILLNGFAGGALGVAIVLLGGFYLVDFSRHGLDSFVLSAYGVLHGGLFGAALALAAALALRPFARRKAADPGEALGAAASRLVFGVAVVLAVGVYYVVARRPTLLLEPSTLLPILLGLILAAVMSLRALGSAGARALSVGSAALVILGCFLVPSGWAKLRPVIVSTPLTETAQIAADPRVPTKRVLLLGWDAATWDLLDPLMAEGRLPNLKRLLATGARGTVASEPQEVQPFADSASAGTRTPALFETIATGKRPLQHGIWDFQAKVFRGVGQAVPFRLGGGWLGQTIPTTSDMARAERVWHMVDRAGLPTLSVGWWNTWPVRRTLDHGVVVSDRAKESIPMTMTPEGAIDVPDVCKTARDAANNAVESLVPALDPNAHDLDDLKDDLRRAFRADYEDDYCHWQLARQLSAESDPRFMALYVSLVDIVQHKFWRYYEPQAFGDEVDPADAEALGIAIGISYDFADDLLGEMLDAFGEDTTVVLVSDHGAGAWAFEGFAGAMKAAFQTVHPEYSGNHRLNGIAVVSGPGVEAGADLGTVYHVDVVPTILRLLGMPVAEDLPGRVLEEAIDQTAFAGIEPPSIPTYQLAASEGSLVPTSSAADEHVEDKLRSLGYID